MTGPKSLILGCQIRTTPINLSPGRTGGYLGARTASLQFVYLIINLSYKRTD
jgi:hypothetical protein